MPEPDLLDRALTFLHLKGESVTQPAPSTPVVSSVVYDQPFYNPGQAGKVTVTGFAGTQVSTRPIAGTATFTDTATGQSMSLAGTGVLTSAVEDATTATFTDTDGRVYTLVSVSQTPAGVVTAVFSFTA